LLRRYRRGNPERAGADSRPASGWAYVFILVQGQERRPAQHWAKAQRGSRPRRKRAQAGRPRPRHRATGQRRGWVPRLLEALRPRPQRRVGGAGGDRQISSGWARTEADAGPELRDEGAANVQLGSIRSVLSRHADIESVFS